MRVAIVGGGIAGLTCAHELAGRADFDLYEANDYIGGHTHTVRVEHEGRQIDVDTGFIVYNDRNYPHFVHLLRQLGIDGTPTEMSFSLSSERSGLEYKGGTLAELFAQRRNALRPSFYRMLGEVLRFFREAPELLEGDDPKLSLGEYLDQRGYRREFCDEHLLPMGAAIWSARPEEIREFPARSFVEFFANHGLLGRKDRPQWYVVRGGSARYVEALTARFASRIHASTRIASITRDSEGVELSFADGGRRRFDELILATHSDQALRLLSAPTAAEEQILGAIRYQPNDVVLHSDERMMPRTRRAWASWNYHRPAAQRTPATVTYDMSRLQHLDTRAPLLVSLNRSAEIDPRRILGRYRYDHPLFDAHAIHAQSLHGEINGRNRTHYCGAYWGFGFHEDGVKSALRVVEGLVGRR